MLSKEELEEFSEEIKRAGTNLSISLDDITRLLKYREDMCNERYIPGLNLDKLF